MIYLDTSALVKLWIDEEASERVRSQVVGASVASSLIAQAELGATLARLERERRLPGDARRAILDDFNVHWQQMKRVGVGPVVARRAADLAALHALRGFDAIHLATANVLRDRFGPLTFACFDQRLAKAAVDEGFALLS